MNKKSFNKTELPNTLYYSCEWRLSQRKIRYLGVVWRYQIGRSSGLHRGNQLESHQMPPRGITALSNILFRQKGSADEEKRGPDARYLNFFSNCEVTFGSNPSFNNIGCDIEL
ncbi:MAG TPA: hypothetical protein VJX67_12050 [Blastocatellia bacterium]|nr:hypothetical protein [Blastocatellia bacterium]